MDGETHCVAGIASGGLVTFYRARDLPPPDRALETAGGMIGGLIGGKAPDSQYVDPSPLGPNHRRFGHSWAMLGAHIYVADAVISAWEKFCREKANEAAWRLANSPAISNFERLLLVLQQVAWRVAAGLLAGFLAGYVSHLALDAFTVKSLPVFGADFTSSPLVPAASVGVAINASVNHGSWTTASQIKHRKIRRRRVISRPLSAGMLGAGVGLGPR
jgi:membrane-bound metal-dependent hydrolase YbcI (DUF457 family)